MDASFTRYIAPVSPTIFPHLATVLLAMGTFFTAWFFVFEVSRPRSDEKESTKEFVLVKELLISLFAAVFLGFGVLFLLLTVGIYV